MSSLKFWINTILWFFVCLFFIWLGDLLLNKDSLFPKSIGGLLLLAGFLFVAGLSYSALGRLAWRTNVFRFLRSFFPPQ